VTLALVLCAALAAGALGLWWGERGRRLAAERWAVSGSPLGARPAQVMPGLPEPEERMAGVSDSGRVISQDTIARGAKRLMDDFRADGRTLSQADAEGMAMQMLLHGDSGLDVLGAL